METEKEWIKIPVKHTFAYKSNTCKLTSLKSTLNAPPPPTPIQSGRTYMLVSPLPNLLSRETGKYIPPILAAIGKNKQNKKHPFPGFLWKSSRDYVCPPPPPKYTLSLFGGCGVRIPSSCTCELFFEIPRFSRVCPVKYFRRYQYSCHLFANALV